MSGDGVFQRNDDGSLTPVQPLAWRHVPGGDWEVYSNQRPMRAELFDEDVLIAVVTARTRPGLAWRMRRATRQEGTR